MDQIVYAVLTLAIIIGIGFLVARFLKKKSADTSSKPKTGNGGGSTPQDK